MDITQLKAKAYDLSKELFRVKEEAEAKINELNNEIVKTNREIEKLIAEKVTKPEDAQ